MAAPRSSRDRRYRGRHRKPPRPQKVVVPIVTIAALSVGGVAFANAVDNGGSGSVRGGDVVPRVPAVAAPTVDQVTHSAPAPTSLVPAARVRPHSLMVRDMTAPCYVRITSAKGKVLVERIMQPGQLVAFRRHGLEVTLGNAGGVRVAVNGRHAHRGGDSGQVRSFHVR